MKVKELLKILKQQDEEAELHLFQSECDWDDVLIVRTLISKKGAEYEDTEIKVNS